MRIANIHEGNMTTMEYFSNVKALEDGLSSICKHVDKNYMMSYLLAGLDVNYTHVMSFVSKYTLIYMNIV